MPSAKNPVRPKPRPKPSPYQQATRLAQQVVQGQYGAINQQTRQANAQLIAARDALIRELQAGLAPAGQAFDAAVGQQQALAQAGAAGLAATNPNAQIQETLQSIGAPVEQQQQIGQLTQAAFPGQGGVLNIQEGTVPGASLVAQKSAAQQFLAGLPAVAGLSGDQSLRALATQAQLERAKIAGQIPSLALSIQEQQERIRQAQLDRQLSRERLALERQQLAPDPLDRYRAVTDRISAQNARRAAQQGERYAPQIIGSGETGYYVYDPNTGKRKRIVAPASGGGGVQGTGLTPYEFYNVQQDLREKREQAFDTGRSNIYKAVGIDLSGDQGFVIKKIGPEKRRAPGKNWTRQTAYSALYSRFGAQMLRAGVTRKSVKAVINTALNQAGFAPPGRRRPKKTGLPSSSIFSSVPTGR